MESPEPDLIPDLPMRDSTPPRTAIGRWLFSGESLDEPHGRLRTHPWYEVLWLTGVDYFSTLGYQPGIALLAAGALSPLATILLVAVTLLGALPVYSQVALRSYAGQGSIAMLENLLSGWRAKLMVLVMIGFAATDFVITMTLSAADAAVHAIENPLLRPWLGASRLSITLALLTLLALVFMMGFVEAIRIATWAAIPYLLLNLIVLVRGLAEIVLHPELISRWTAAIAMHGDWTGIFIVSALVFPKLALGMSGYETGVTVMPLVAGGTDDRPRERPFGRIHATRRLLAAAALIMAGMLLLSSFVTTLLIPSEAYQAGGIASGRAIAWLAHDLLGPYFGTVYDLSTIVILWFAGASAMAGLISLIPRYLPRFGMAPRWVAYRRPMVLVLFVIDVLVTLAFHADVEAQGGAYATGVLALMVSAAVAVALALGREARAEAAGRLRRWSMSLYFWVISAIFAYTFVDNVFERPDGVIIATLFILGILSISGLSRAWRSTELRVSGMSFLDDASKEHWRSIRDKRVHLVPLATFDLEGRARKAAELRRHYAVEGPLAFIHVNLLDNRSEFIAPLQVRVTREEDQYLIEVFGAIAIANSIAYISELIDPRSIFLGLTRENMMMQSLRYIFWGEGEIGLMVYTILVRYWEWTPEDDVRPLMFLMSE